MNTKTLNSREFFRSPAKVARLVRAGTRIVVTRNGKELFEAIRKQAVKKKTIADFKHLIFSDPNSDPDMSKKIDEIVYGDI
jgi:3-keto-L-gulonate-6-phosphate decarboxylase